VTDESRFEESNKVGFVCRGLQCGGENLGGGLSTPPNMRKPGAHETRGVVDLDIPLSMRSLDAPEALRGNAG
jgi:hypothetical protein